MASDWQIGDLAVCVMRGRQPCPLHAGKIIHRGVALPAGAAKVVGIRMELLDSGSLAGTQCGCVVLDLDDGSRGATWRFRKVRTDAHEACEEEFVTLLKRKKVSA